MTKNQKLLLIGGGVALLALVAVRGVRGVVRDAAAGVGGAAVDAVAGVFEGAYEALPDAIKPTSPGNIVYQAASEVAKRLPGGDASDTFGTWLYNITHPYEKF